MRALALALALAACASRTPAPAAPPAPATPDVPVVIETSPVDAGAVALEDVPPPPEDVSPPADGVPPPGDAGRSACVEQPPQPFLIRGFYVAGTPGHGAAQHRAAIDYRTRHYGRFESFGAASLNPFPPMHYAVTARFMGLPVRVHRRIVPALACVEREIARACADRPYRPSRLNGIRPANSFHGGELSNHVYGIAIDVDPHRNPCCGCGAAFANHPTCRRPATTPYSRMDIPECWVRAFERYGFYWLGRDRALRDMMHFEFLGDPDRLPQP